MSDTDVGEQISDAIGEAGGLDGVIPASGADSGADETAQEAEERRYAGKYRTTEDLEKGYHETDKARTQAQQELAEARRQLEELQSQQAEEPSPFGMMGPMPEDLEYLAQRDPGNAYYQSLVHAQQLGIKAPEIQNQLYMNWFMQDPTAAMDYRLQMMQAANQPEEPDGNDFVTQQAVNTFFEQTVSSIRSQLPDLESYAPQIVAEITPDQLEKILAANDPTASLQKLIRKEYWNARGEASQNQAAPTAKPAAGVASQRRSSAPAAADTAESRIHKAILEAPKRGIFQSQE